jgi:hypothetical protein
VTVESGAIFYRGEPTEPDQHDRRPHVPELHLYFTTGKATKSPKLSPKNGVPVTTTHVVDELNPTG